MFHKVILVGNLGRDPELRYTPSGQAVANLSVATNRRFTDSSGEQREVAGWFRGACVGAPHTRAPHPCRGSGPAAAPRAAWRREGLFHQGAPHVIRSQATA